MPLANFQQSPIYIGTVSLPKALLEVVSQPKASGNAGIFRIESDQVPITVVSRSCRPGQPSASLAEGACSGIPGKLSLVGN